jgi:hypothetical protein
MRYPSIRTNQSNQDLLCVRSLSERKKSTPRGCCWLNVNTQDNDELTQTARPSFAINRKDEQTNTNKKMPTVFTSGGS